MSKIINFCPVCGSKTEDKYQKFCSKCGSPFEISTYEEKLNPEITITNNGNQYIAPPPYSREAIDAQANTNSQHYADFGDRFVAFIIDSIILSLIGSLIGMGVTGTFGFGFDVWNLSFWKSRWFNILIGFLYFWGMESFNNGQTLGKMAMHIKTVDTSTLNTITSGQAALHVVGKVLFLPLDVILGFIIYDESLQNKGQSRVTQQLSKTTVIKI